MAGNRSVFVAPDYSVDQFPTLYNLPPELAGDAQELQQLQMTANKTAEQNTRMNNLTSELANYLINPETFNHFADCIFNLESNWLNIYHEFTDYIDQAQQNIDTYINNKESDMNNFVNQKQIDITNFVNTKEAEMESVKDAYLAAVNKKEKELQDLDSRTERYWQKWNASANGQTDYNLFDPTAYNTTLPTTATIDIDMENVDVVINGVRQCPYIDYDKKQNEDGQYTIITLKGNASNLVNIGTEVFVFYYKNVGNLYFRHASTHEAGGRDQITTSEPMLDDNLSNKINNYIVVSDTTPTNPFKGQIWFAPA
jgi:hypothetical protein